MASLAALRLLKQVPEAAINVSIIGFAAPAVGNAALAEYISKAGWGDSFISLLLPGLLQHKNIIHSVKHE